MTLKEAKKILKKEGFYVEKATRPCAISESFTEYEDPTICEAMQVVNSAGYGISMEVSCFNERKTRLAKELEEHGNAPMPGPGEEQPKEGNPALKEAASQFNDALLDEQAKKIARLKKIIHKKNMKIEEFRKESSIHLRGKIKMFVKNRDLEGKLKDKDAVLSDVAEELRLSKIREKNLTEVCQKYMKENEELKKELADKVVDEIDARALKSAESALAYKEKVIAEKDDVIADLGKELKAQKDLVDDISLKYDGAKHNLKLRMDECEKLKKELEGTNNLVRMVRNTSKEYCEYGIAAEKMIQKMAKVIVNEGPVSSKDFKEYRRLADGYRFNPQLPDFSEEEEKKLEHAKKIRVSSDNAEEGADLYGVIVLCGKDVIDALKKAKDADIWQE